MILYEKKI